MAIKLYCMLFCWGARAGCHQRPDRSFFYKTYQFPVCARCTGVLIGYAIAIPVYCFYGNRCLYDVPVALVMLLDWSLQFLGIKESTNKRRFITGILGGYGIGVFQIWSVFQIVNIITKFLR